jgi:hypothetical protein
MPQHRSPYARQLILSTLLVVAVPAVAHADEVDVTQYSFWEVVYTTDGSITKGIVVEHEQGKQYKVALLDGGVRVIPEDQVEKVGKEPNPYYESGRGDVVGVHRGRRQGGDDRDLGELGTTESIPRPIAEGGPNASVELTFIFPTGVLAEGEDGETSFLEPSLAPTVRIGYAAMFGRVSLSGGAMSRFTYWMLNDEVPNRVATWLLEVGAYGRGAVHVGRAAPYAGLSLGTDIIYVTASGMSETANGLGMNLDFGLDVFASPSIALGLGGTYHPSLTDLPKIDYGPSYWALHLDSRFSF